MKISVWPKEGDAAKVLHRKIAWDCLPCQSVGPLTEAIGMHGASEDVMDAEHEDSHRRLDPVMPLAGALHQIAHMVGATLSRALPHLVEGDPLEHLDPETREWLLTMVAFSGSVAALATLRDEDLITLPGG